jgi:hypothetical protein
MIKLWTDDAKVIPDGQLWTVVHAASRNTSPGGRGVLLASCDTEEEAVRTRDAYNDLVRQLRAVGLAVR